MRPAAARPRPAWLATAAPVNEGGPVGLVVVGPTGVAVAGPLPPVVLGVVVPLPGALVLPGAPVLPVPRGTLEVRTVMGVVDTDDVVHGIVTVV
jgi:hypothetical protein